MADTVYREQEQCTTVGILELQLLMLLFVANGTPILAKRLLGSRFAWPIDGDLNFVDDRPLFGRAKTWRGLVLAPSTTALAAFLLGLPADLGLFVGLLAMAGDLAASFAKRRLGLRSSSRAPVLDQVPESLLPTLGCMLFLDLGWVSVLVIVAAFSIGGFVLSGLLYRMGIRERPY